jgi:HPt (histidine-containing phosphotransfer) domain-containing protein
MPDAETPVLDASVLAELKATTGDDPAFVRDLVETYLADVPVQLDGIESAIAASDADALIRPAHTLKSSSATLGAMRLADISRALEMTGRSGALGASADDNAKAARAEWQSVEAAFSAWMAGEQRG